jgi:hypothetical protein
MSLKSGGTRIWRWERTEEDEREGGRTGWGKREREMVDVEVTERRARPTSPYRMGGTWQKYIEKFEKNAAKWMDGCVANIYNKKRAPTLCSTCRRPLLE